MQSKVLVLLVLFFVISITIIPQSYADEYRVSTTSGCGIIPGIWIEVDKTCTLNDNLVIDNVNNDILIIDPLTKLVVPSGFELTSEGGQIKIDGTLENHGIIINNSGDVEVVGTFDNFFMYENNGGMDVAGIFTNNDFGSATTEFTNSETVNITGTFNNLGTLQNTNGIFILDTTNPPGTLINSGEITNTNVWHVSGLFTNHGSFTQDGFMPVLASGNIENSGSFSSLSAAGADISGTITIKSGSTFTNNGIMLVFPSGKIIIESTLDNTGEINNQCGLITDAITTNQPNDKCPPEVTIITPINNKKYGNQLAVELSGTAIDKNNLGVEIDLSSSLIWAIKQGSNTELSGTGSPVDHLFSNLGQNTVITSVIDSGGNLDSSEINVEIVSDADSDGFVDSEDCNPNDPLVYLGAPERINGIDDSCDGILSPDEVDSDSDGYILGLFVSANWLGTPVPTGGSDCNDTNATVNPGANELSVIDGVDTDCNPLTNNPDEIDSDSDGYILGLFVSANWLGTPVPTGGSDCNDTNALINPGALEIANGIDDNCDGIIDFGLDDDGDGYVTGNIIGVSDCDDTDPEINPAAIEIFGDGIDNNCNDFIDEVVLLTLDDFYNVDANTVLSVSAPGVLINDKSSGNDPLFVTLQSSPVGTLTFNLDGSFTYIPTTLFFGSDSFSYVASDGVFESNISTVTLNQKFCGKDKSEFNKVIVGTNSHDHLLGTRGNDLILGLDGNDKINGLDGDDCIYGGNGNDKINGNNGIDEIRGGNGNDRITGNNDNDKLFGDDGKDKIQGNNGDDFIDGGANSDYCKGGHGSNTIINCEKDDDHDDDHDDEDDIKILGTTSKGRFNHK